VCSRCAPVAGLTLKSTPGVALLASRSRCGSPPGNRDHKCSDVTTIEVRKYVIPMMICQNTQTLVHLLASHQLANERIHGAHHVSSGWVKHATWIRSSATSKPTSSRRSVCASGFTVGPSDELVDFLLALVAGIRHLEKTDLAGFIFSIKNQLLATLLLYLCTGRDHFWRASLWMRRASDSTISRRRPTLCL